MHTREDLIAEGQRWKGVPCLESGSHRCGVNCIGLFIGVLRELGGYEELVEGIEKYAGYRLPTSPRDFLRKFMSSPHVRMVKPSQFLKGNLVLFFTGGTLQHVGMVTGDSMVLHASQTQGKVVEHRLPENWKVFREFELVELEK